MLYIKRVGILMVSKKKFKVIAKKTKPQMFSNPTAVPKSNRFGPVKNANLLFMLLKHLNSYIVIEFQIELKISSSNLNLNIKGGADSGSMDVQYVQSNS